jgi:hypothetical protein
MFSSSFAGAGGGGTFHEPEEDGAELAGEVVMTLEVRLQTPYQALHFCMGGQFIISYKTMS